MTTAGDKVTIRQITTADLRALRHLRLEALYNNPVGFSADPESELKRSDSTWRKRIQESPIFMAWDGEDPVGMAGFYHDKSSKTGHHGTIWGVYVQPAYRGRGLCGKLVSRCLQYARQNGLHMAYIAAAAGNTAAIRCYAGCGFTVYGLQPMAILHDGVYHDELLMAQEL